MKWQAASLLPEDIQNPDNAFNLKAIVGQLQGKRGQHITNGSGAAWRMVSPRSNRNVNGALLIQRRGLDPKTRKPKWLTVSRFGSDGVISTSTAPSFTNITPESPYTTNGVFQYTWMSDGSVVVRGSVNVNTAISGSKIAAGLPAAVATETFQVSTNNGAMSVTVDTAGDLYTVTIPGGAVSISLAGVRYIPATGYNMASGGQEPQQ